MKNKTVPERNQSAFAASRPSQDRILYPAPDSQQAEDTDSALQFKLGEHDITTETNL